MKMGNKSHEEIIRDYSILISNIDSDSWFKDNIKEKTIDFIYDRLLTSNTVYSITKLLPFEIYLLQDEYNMLSLGGLNTYSSIRSYQKEEILISLNLGIQGESPYPFYFTDSRLVGVHGYYEPINNREDYLLYRDDIEQRFNKTKPFVIKKGDGFIIPNIELKQ